MTRYTTRRLTLSLCVKRKIMATDLFSLSDNIHDEKTFIEFLIALMKDRELEVEKEKAQPSSPYEPGALGWQNLTIEGFLESAVAWAEATNGKKESNPWKRAAQIIQAGKTYE